MADLGDIQVSRQFYARELVVCRLHVNDISSEMYINAPTKHLAGTLKLNGAVAARSVRIHHRATGLPVTTITSGTDGSFYSDGVSSDEYYVVALPLAGDAANAVIIDRVQGV